MVNVFQYICICISKVWNSIVHVVNFSKKIPWVTPIYITVYYNKRNLFQFYVKYNATNNIKYNLNSIKIFKDIKIFEFK